jgi:hypothetical protein
MPTWGREKTKKQKKKNKKKKKTMALKTPKWGKPYGVPF